LRQRGLTTGYADYWTAYPITYVSGEEIVLSPALPFDWTSRIDRYPPYTQRVDAVTDPARVFLLVDQRCSIAPYLEALDARQARYRVEPVARWRLVSDIRALPADESATLHALRTSIAAQSTC
jgi:hypothetical protein